MKVLTIASGDFFSTYGGGQVYVKNLVDTFISMGINVSIISIVNKNQEVRETEYRDHTLIQINQIGNLKNAILKVNPDIIHAHSLKAETCRIGKELGIPVVTTAHHGGILCPAGALLDNKDEICSKRVNHYNCLTCVLCRIPAGTQLWYPLMKHLNSDYYIKLGNWLEKKPLIPFITPVGIAARSIAYKKKEWQQISDLCSHMIAPSQRMAEAMIRNGMSESKISVIPHGVHIPQPVPNFTPIIDGKIKFFFVGRICYVKGLHILIKAFLQLPEQNIELHLIGEAVRKSEFRYFNRLKRLSRNDNRIIWHGKVAPENIFDITSRFHVAISPSIFLEVFGLNIAEALALGKPVIASRSGGGEMQIIDGYNGWLVEPNDSQALLRTFNEIIHHPETISRISRNCKAISIQEHADTLLNLYQAVTESYHSS